MSLKAELKTWAAALKAYDEQNIEQALDLFSRIAHSSKILTNMGIIYATIGKHETAVEHFVAATNLDSYLAIAYFQSGVSNFLLQRYDLALLNLEDAYLYLRGNEAINYEQVGLKFKLFSAEIMFNKGLAKINLGYVEGGMADMQEASRQKATYEHSVIDEAIRDRGDGYTVFSIPTGVLYRPSESKLKNCKSKDYLGKAKLVAVRNLNDAFTGFSGVKQPYQASEENLGTKKDNNKPDAKSSAATMRIDNFGHIAYIPSEGEDGTHLGKLGEVCSGTRWKGLGCSIAQESCREAAVGKLGIQPHPLTSMLLSLLEKTPPPNEATARHWFEILVEHISSFTQSQWTILSKLPIVPMKGSGAQPLRWLAPTQCYLRDDTRGEFHSKLFVFVDFGPVANRFLSACGSKKQPSINEVAEILISDPNKFYELSGGYENFLAEVRNLAINGHAITFSTLSKMKISPILLGVRRKKASKTFLDTEWDEEGWEDLHDLRKPSEVVIADDMDAYQLFSDSIFTAPQEDLLESFYASLGSRRLSTFIREEYTVSNEGSDTKTASDVRALILERLPLFLHEHIHTHTKVSLSWLSGTHNFKVKVFANLVVSKTLDFGSGKTTRTLDASATAKRVGTTGPIELWLSDSTQVDMYEIATSLCRLLFEKAKVNDALLFMTILSTDLKVLKRRGYNVDKILKQQQQDRKLVEDTRRSFYTGAKVSNSSTTLIPQPVKPLVPLRANHPDSIATRSKSPTRGPRFPRGWKPTPGSFPLRTTPNELLITRPPISPPTPEPTNNTYPIKNLRRKLISHVPSSSSSESDIVRSSPSPPPTIPPPAMTPCVPEQPPNELVTTRPPTSPSTPEPINNAYPIGDALQNLRRKLISHVPSSSSSESEIVRSRPSPQAPQNTRHVTPQRNIWANVDMAVACKPKEGTLLHNRKRVELVSESLNEDYCESCDTSDQVGNLELLGKMGDVKVFATTDVPDTDTFMARMRDPLARFIHVITPLAQIYDLPTTSLHIFYDMGGGPVAFNRNGSIFLNLLYFEAWHDQDVENGYQRQAQISWFFTLARKITDNLVESHLEHSDYEFYFSAICEAHIFALSGLVGAAGCDDSE